MKVTKDSKTGRDIYKAENPKEQAALDYLNNHRPLFALAEPYIVTAYVAGYDAGTVSGACDELRRAIRDVQRIASDIEGATGQLQDAADEVQQIAQEERAEARKGNKGK